MKRLLHYRIRGGILPLVLAISLIMASLCSILLMLAYYHMQYRTVLSIRSKLQRNLASAAEISLASPASLPLDQWLWLDLYEEGVDSIAIRRTYWGAYELVQLKAVQAGQHVAKSILLGTAPGPAEPALYVADERRSIKLAGDVLIRGDAYLPEAGIKAGYIDRFGYSKQQLVFGNTFQSKEHLPVLHDATEKSIRDLLSTAGTLLPLEEFGEQVQVSYSHPQIAGSHTASAIDIKNGQTLKGKILIRSDKQIIIRQGAELQGVVLVAPVILFERGFRGVVQAFATDTLIIGENAQLLYPSAVGLVQNSEAALVELLPGVRLEGLLFLLSDQQFKRKGKVLLHEQSEVVGNVYVDGFLQHEGIVVGSVSARKLHVKTKLSDEEDYLFNGHIDRVSLPKEFVGSSMVLVKGKRKVIEWLE